METFKTNTQQNLSLFTADNSLIRRTSIFLICLFSISILSVGHSYGQLDQEDISNFSHRINHISTSGDTMEFSFQLGTASNQAEGVAGFDITIDFTDLASDPDAVLVSVANSWVGTTNDGTLSYNFDAANDELNFDYDRTDASGQDGHGEIATLYLIREGGFSSSEAVAVVDGGIIMVDNMDFKWSPQDELAETSEIKIYPNPASSFVKVETGTNTSQQVSLLDLNGRVQRHQNGMGTHQLDLSGLAKGVYFIQVQTGDQIQRQQLVVQ